MARVVSPVRVSNAPVTLQTDFYREEFLKHRACLARQREYYSERAITDADRGIERILSQLEQLCATRNIGFLDTPVVLGQEAADEGTLTVFCGGRQAAFDKARPVLSAFGINIMHVGECGMGQLTKTANNMLLWACMAANYEVLSMMKRMGADIPKLVGALQHSSGANWSLEKWGRSTGKWAEKDMDVALELAQEAKVPVPLAALVDQLMKGMTQEKMKSLLG